jgi:hypothetical protein
LISYFLNILLRNSEKILIFFKLKLLKLISQKRLKCKNLIKYFKCNNFALLDLIWCPNRSISFYSSLIWVYFILKLCKKSNLQNWNIIFIYKWNNIWGKFFKNYSLVPPLRFFLQLFSSLAFLERFYITYSLGNSAVS